MVHEKRPYDIRNLLIDIRNLHSIDFGLGLFQFFKKKSKFDCQVHNLWDEFIFIEMYYLNFNYYIIQFISYFMHHMNLYQKCITTNMWKKTLY